MPPERLLDDWLTSYLEFTFNTEPRESYRLWSGISAIAGSLQRKCVLRWGSVTFYPNLYVVLVGPPAARKGTAMGPAGKMLSSIGVTLSANKTTEEALIQALAESGQAVVNHETGDAYIHSSLTIFSPELTVFLNKKNSGIMDELTDWFDCLDRWEYRTKHQGTNEIAGVFVNLLGATTPELLRTTLPIEAFGSGFMSRIIFIFEDDKGKTVPVPLHSQEEIDLQLKLVSDLKQILALEGEFKVTKNFVDAWIDWYTLRAENVSFNDKRFEGYVQRRQVHVMKLCMICSASRSNEMKLRVEDLNRAISILEQAERQMPAAFSGIGRNQDSATMENLMTEIALRKTISYRDLMAQFYHDVNQKTFDDMIHTLRIMKFIDLELTGDLGSSIIKYRGESSESLRKTLNELSKENRR